MKFKALLFDFYGTIVEEADAYVEKICTVISRHLDHTVLPREISKQWFEIVPKVCYEAYGKKFRLQKDIAVESLETVLHSLRCALDAHELIKTIHKYWNAPRIFPESRNVLVRCNLPICIISNVDDEFIYRALKMHGLNFTNVVTSESCRSYKPRVDIFLKALSMIGLSNNEVLHIGDSYQNDVLGAKAAGIPSLWINRKKKTLRPEDPAPEFVARTLKGVLDFL